MKKNVASQTISAVVVSATDGSAITASVAVTVTGDAGTQGAGGGTLAHEGGGEWSYVPTQAETNFDHIMFKFSASGAIPVGVQVYTQFPQTGDSFARIGAPAGASASADIAAVKAQTAAIETDTAEIGAAGAGLTNINLPNQTMDIVGNITGNLSGSVGSVTGAVGSVTGNVGGNVTGTVGGFAAGQGPRIRKNVALAAFPFLMTDSTNHAPATGLTVTATRSLDGAAFGACANAVSEIGNGWYKISLATTDTNADTIAFRMTATGADDLPFTVVTNP